jgi:1-acyl-sn-glycerol-3-phosphate acyltransferase
MLCATIWATLATDSLWPYLIVGVMVGIIAVPLRAANLSAWITNRRAAQILLLTSCSCSVLLFTLVLVTATQREHLHPLAAHGLLVVLAAVAVLAAWRGYYRESVEQLLEILLWPIYRIRSSGPGKCHVPLHGPLLVVANHTAWLDPVWVAKVVPRRVIPMMTSTFYDLPILRWLMKHVAQAIRVERTAFRREAPELQEAIAALDRGECVTIFPEGFLKRRADQGLRQFGQGVWRILRERPTTPVMVCWIEGGWGCYTSYYNGPPTVNKRLDWWRRIAVSIGEPQVLDAALLEDQRATRNYLMHACLEQRKYLGLETLTPAQVDEKEAAV